MTEAIQNNISEKPQRLDVGIITPPDKSPTPNLIPESTSKNTLAQVKNDVFQKKKTLSYNDSLQTPIGVKVIFGAIVTFMAAIGIKKLFKSVKK